jgi:uncharacterized protein with beta-barrel porin domain
MTVARALSAVGAIAATMPASAQPAPPSWNLYSGYTDSANLTFINNPLPNPVEVGSFPSLKLTLSGNHTEAFTMDTGSTGIVVSQAYFTPGPNDRALGQGNAIYTSDGIILKGTYWQTQVTVTGANGNTVTSNVKILVVPDSGVRMMGVGFDRGGNKPQDGVTIDQPGTDQNPFLNIVAINGTPVANMRRGYVVGSQGVTLGLTAAQSSGFAISKLTPNAVVSANVWNRPNASLSVSHPDGGTTHLGTGGFLADTGIAYSIVTPIGKIPESERVDCKAPLTGDKCLRTLNDVAVVLTPGLPADVASRYTFKVRDEDARDGYPLNPTQVNLRATDDNNLLKTDPSLNTGLAFYMGFDYLFDFDGGYVGYRWAAAPNDMGSTTPLISLQGNVALPSGFAVSLPVYLVDNTTLQPSGPSTFTGPLSGLGKTLVISGSGSVAFNGAVDMAGGNFTVMQGLASINDSLKANVITVGAGGWLGGSGTITGDIVHQGAIAPGNSIGTLNVVGSLTQTAGSSYVVEVNAAGQSDLISVQGAAMLQGGTVAVLPASGLYAPTTRYTILTANGGVSGAYGSAVSAYPFLKPSLAYTANSVVLTLQAGGFAAGAATPNQAAVGRALDAGAVGATGDFATVLANLSTASLEQGQAFMTAISGQNYAGFSSTMVQGAQLFMNTFANQAGGGGAAANRVALAEVCDVACDTTSALWGAWGGAVGGLGTIGAGAAIGSVTYNLGGFAAGLDRLVAPGLRVGVTMGYAAGTQWISGFGGQGQSSTIQAGLYANFGDRGVYLDALAGYAYSDNRMLRTIAVPGLGTRIAQGQAGANQLFGQLEGGYRIDLGRAADAYVTPFVRLQGYAGTQNAFSETGAQSLNLSVAAQTTNSLRTVLGAQLGGALDLGWREKLSLSLRLGWSHEYADTARPVTAALAGASATPFTTFGIAPQRDSALLGFAIGTSIAEGTKLYARYEGNFSGQDSTHALTAGVRVTW